MHIISEILDNILIPLIKNWFDDEVIFLNNNQGARLTYVYICSISISNGHCEVEISMTFM